MKIVAACLNKNRPPLIDTKEEKWKHQLIARKMLAKSRETINPLANLVNSEDLARGWKRAKDTWDHDEKEITHPMTAPDFPRVTEDEIEREITFGTYQIRQGKHYTDEHMISNGGFKISVHQEQHELLRARIQSKYRGDTSYFVWVRYRKRPAAVLEWYCQCKTGMRTVGCCSHVATLIWYLGVARHQNYDPTPNHETVWSFIADAGDHDSGDHDSEE